MFAFSLNQLWSLKPSIPLSSPLLKITLSLLCSMGVTCFLVSFHGHLPYLLWNFLKIFCHMWVFYLPYPPPLWFVLILIFSSMLCLPQSLVLMMAPSKFSAISDVKGSGFISDHKIISCVVDFPSLHTLMQKVVTFHQFHKLDIDKFRSDLLAIPL